MNTATELCPQCGHTMPVNPGFVTWCDRCRWNIDPSDDSRKSNVLFEKLNRRFGDKACRHLLDDVKRNPLLKHRVTGSGAAAYAFSAMLLGMICWIGYLAFTYLVYFNTFGDVCIGILLAILFFVLRPRIFRNKAKWVQRSEYPALFQTVDRMTEALQIPSIDGIVLDYDYNASFGVYGFRRKKILTIGIPLFSTLTAQEKLAIIGHEIGHHANKDISRKLLVSSMLNSLGRLHVEIYPKSDYSEFLGPLHYLLSWIRKAGAWAILVVWYALGLTLWKDSQRAEYYADYVAASVAGTDAAVSALKKLYYAPTFYKTLERVGHYNYTKNLFDEYRGRTKYVPEREIERISLLSESASSRLDSTHPPTVYRIDFLKQIPLKPVEINLSPSELDMLEQEFLRAEGKIEKQLLDLYRAYYVESA